MKFRCLFASNIKIPAATETFIESMAPCIGMIIFFVAFCNHSSDNPVASVPTTMAVEFLKSWV